MSPPQQLVSALAGLRRVVTVGHVTPDADSLGSMLALARAWPKGDGQTAAVSLPDAKVSSRLRFLLDLAEPTLAGPKDFERADGFVVTDTARRSRTNIPRDLKAHWPDGRTVINIDHHLSNTAFGDVNWIAPAASVCEMVYALLVATKCEIDAVTASLLYAGMMTDTVGFSLPGISGNTLRIAASLVDHGANVGLLGEQLGRSLSANEFNLLRSIYDNTRLTNDGRIAYSTATYDQIQRAGCDANDIDDQVAVPRSMIGIRIAVLLTEGRRGRVRINFRGENGTPVIELARMFGGGGHLFASGAIVDGDIDDALAAVLPVALRYLDELDAAPAGDNLEQAHRRTTPDAVAES